MAISKTTPAEDFAEEIASHLKLEVDELLREGHSEVDAHRLACVAFNNPAFAVERFRLRSRIPWVDSLTRDLWFSLRQLRRSPAFTATAILTLGLGLGANTAVFSLVNALLLRPLPVPHSEQLVVLRIDRPGFEEPSYNFNAPMFRALEKRHSMFDRVAASSRGTLQVRSTSGNQQIAGLLVSGQFFAALETPPLLGRYLLPLDDQAKGSPDGSVAVISKGFWRDWFDSAPDVVGRKLVIANAPFTVVGVMPRHFIGADPTIHANIFLPLASEPIVDSPYNMIEGGYHANWLNVIGRRKAGISLEQAIAGLQESTMPVLEESGADADWITEARSTHAAHC